MNSHYRKLDSLRLDFADLEDIESTPDNYEFGCSHDYELRQIRKTLEQLPRQLQSNLPSLTLPD